MAVSNVELIVNAVKAINPLRKVEQQSKKVEQALKKNQKAAKGVTSATTKVGREMKTAANGMQYFIDAAGRARKANGQFVTTTEAAAAGLEGQGAAAKAAAGKLSGLKGALIGLGLGAVTKNIVNQAAQFAQTQIRIKALASEYGEYDQAQKLIAKNAKNFNLSLAESSNQFADIFARLRPVGKSLDEIQTTFEGFNAVALVSGASAASASAAFLQLSQALGSGRLQGDEFRSISEQLPGILKLVADEMKVQVSDLKKLGSEGKITADILINSLAKGFDQNKDKIQAILNQSPAAKFKAFGNAVSELSTAVGTELLPVITPFVEKATELLKQVRGMPKPLKQAAGGVLLLGTAAAIALPAIGGLATTLSVMGTAQIAALGKIVLGLAAIGGTSALIFELSKSVTEFQDLIDTGSVEDLQKEAERLETAIAGLEKPAVVGGESLDAMGVSAAVASGELSELQSKLQRVQTAITQRTDLRPDQGAFDFSAVQAAIKKAQEAMKPKPLTEEEKKLLEQTQKQNQAASERLRISSAELKIMSEQSATDKIRLQFALKKANTEAKYTDLLSKALSDEERSNLRAAQRNDLEKLRLEKNEAIVQSLQDQFKMYDDLDASVLAFTGHTQELSEEFKSIADTINNEILNGIQGMIDGTKTLSDVASSMLRRIADQMLEIAIMGQQGSGGIAGTLLSAVGSIFGGGPTLAGPGGFSIGSAATPLTGGLDFSGAFANGGRPAVGKAALVGERGPELFVPDRAGTIIPNSALGGSNIVVNVDASGSNVQGDGQQGKALGQAIGAAVQAELIKQKRPGGLLS